MPALPASTISTPLRSLIPKHFTTMHPSTLLPLISLLPLATCLPFTVLTYNVAGLPTLLNPNGIPGDKTANTRLIGSKLLQLNASLVHMQEDFNYHAALYSTLAYPFRTPTTGGVPFGSGLNTVANYPWTEIQRVKWDRCDVNSGDCLTPKGFSFMRLQVPGGELDAYNLHADAGSNAGDVAAREAGVRQMLAFMQRVSPGRAVVVAGDTNDRYTNAGESLSVLIEGAGLRDPWIDIVKGGARPVKGSPAIACGNPAVGSECEIVDKVLYRSGNGVRLEAKNFEYASSRFLQDDGSVLSDHNPVLVSFDLTRV
ncbi:hypothetical protein CAC42_137 [Sphaceloma murrayae]|uniref:Inositol polyphosphate-related phosphatase domain-containing protein n=1 Tax=Sphaceloma murrayae TaxID=2082308 RepID=A0A2K1QNH9_9PEZI|nr:hypothetical protein CAC42_137 [Sphaceloma murrayae]